MKAMEELHVIVKTQKTTRISRLRKIVKRLALEIMSKDKMIRSQRTTIDHLNRSHSQLQLKYDRLKKKMDSYEVEDNKAESLAKSAIKAMKNYKVKDQDKKQKEKTKREEEK